MSVTPNFLTLDNHDWLVTQSIGIMLVMLENVVDMLIQVLLKVLVFITHSGNTTGSIDRKLFNF